jgi:hypothetical protein
MLTFQQIFYYILKAFFSKVIDPIVYSFSEQPTSTAKIWGELILLVFIKYGNDEGKKKEPEYNSGSKLNNLL